jgi:hypothetical protein
MDENERRGWYKYAVDVTRIPVGFLQLGIVDGGFMHVHVDAIASYGPMHFMEKTRTGVPIQRFSNPIDKDPQTELDFLGTPLRLHGDAKKEATMVLHSIAEISDMCESARQCIVRMKCRT